MSTVKLIRSGGCVEGENYELMISYDDQGIPKGHGHINTDIMVCFTVEGNLEFFEQKSQIIEELKEIIDKLVYKKEYDW